VAISEIRELYAMSNEKVEFILPCSFTIAVGNSQTQLINYSRSLSNIDCDKQENHNKLDNLVKGIIEGETRIIAAGLSLEDLFSNRDEIKKSVVEKVQHELNKYGLVIENANIRELKDAVGSNYFSEIRKKTLANVESKASIDTAEAKKQARIGIMDREKDTRIQLASYNMTAVEKENDAAMKIAHSNADLAEMRAEAKRRSDIADIDAKNRTEIRNIELQTEMEKNRISQQTELLRAQLFSKANVEAETTIKKAEGLARQVEIEAQARAAQMRIEAEAKAISIETLANANLHAKLKEADGIQKLYDAQANGITELMRSFGNDKNSLLQFVMLEKNVYQQLAKENANAIQNLNPKITVWNTTSSGSSFADPFKNIMQMIPPLLTTINDQTGLKIGGDIVSHDNVDKK